MSSVHNVRRITTVFTVALVVVTAIGAVVAGGITVQGWEIRRHHLARQLAAGRLLDQIGLMGGATAAVAATSDSTAAESAGRTVGTVVEGVCAAADELKRVELDAGLDQAKLRQSTTSFLAGVRRRQAAEATAAQAAGTLSSAAQTLAEMLTKASAEVDLAVKEALTRQAEADTEYERLSQHQLAWSVATGQVAQLRRIILDADVLTSRFKVAALDDRATAALDALAAGPAGAAITAELLEPLRAAFATAPQGLLGLRKSSLSGEESARQVALTAYETVAHTVLPGQLDAVAARLATVADEAKLRSNILKIERERLGGQAVAMIACSSGTTRLAGLVAALIIRSSTMARSDSLVFIEAEQLAITATLDQALTLAQAVQGQASAVKLEIPAVSAVVRAREALSGDDGIASALSLAIRMRSQADAAARELSALSAAARLQAKTMSDQASDAVVRSVLLAIGAAVVGLVLSLLAGAIALHRGRSTSRLVTQEIAAAEERERVAAESERRRAERLLALAARIAQEAEALRADVEQLAGAGRALGTAMTQAKLRTTAITASAVTTGRSIAAAAHGAGELAASVSSVAATSREAATQAEHGRTEAGSATATVQDLLIAGREIDEAAQLIGDIAERTNLLALNATIEAARAGAAGRGFTVVASEVKDLARQATLATQTIAQRIEHVQKGADGSSKAIAQIAQRVGAIASGQQVIASAVERQTATTTGMARTLSEAEGAITSLAADLGQVDAAVAAATSQSERLEHLAAELGRLAAGLDAACRELRDA